MSGLAAALVWRAVQMACHPAHATFWRAIGDTAAAQQSMLQSILNFNRDTAFGRQHSFGSISSWHDYRAAVPIQTPLEYRDFAMRIGAGEHDLLSPQSPEFFGMTSGSSGEVKLIAHPPAGLAAFRRAVQIWLADLLANRPAIRRGRAYLSISPPLAGDPGCSSTGVPYGMRTPSRHFAAWAEFASRRISITPAHFDAEQCWIDDIPAWRLATACLLAASSDLSLISIAGPSFFDVLWQTILENASAIVAAVHGGFAVPGMTACAPDPARARELERVLCAGSPDPVALWPQLAVLSCWAHAASSSPAQVLAKRLPQAWMQPKGLWATEAPVSLPLVGLSYPVLAVNCACYEFLDDSGGVWLAHELQKDGCYRVVLTTAGGLYRYDLGDRVRVRGFAGTAPLLEFMGRDGVQGDLAGEKLTDAFVGTCLPVGFGVSLLVASAAQRRYLLVVDADRCDGQTAKRQAALTETALCRHWLYADRRALGMLEGVTPLRVRCPAKVIDCLFLQQGLRADGGKLLALAPFPTWEKAFRAAIAD